MFQKKKILLIFFFAVLFKTDTCIVYAQQDGVYVSKPATNREINKTFKEYVRRVVINSVLEETGELVKRIARIQQLPIMPQMANVAIQQVALQVFKQEELMETCREAYDQSLDLLNQQREDGINQESIKYNVRNKAKEVLKPIYDDPYYKHIVEEVLKFSIKEQQRILVTHAAQKQVQMMVIQQQMQQMQQAALQAYLTALTSNPIKK